MCSKRKAVPASAASPNKKVKGKTSASSSAPSSAKATPTRPKPKPLNKSAGKRRAASPSESSYNDDTSVDELESDDDDPKEVDEEGSDGSWAEDEATPKKGKGKGKKRANPVKPGARGTGRARGGGRAHGRTGAGSSAPAAPVRQFKMIGDQIDPLDELADADSDASLASWNEEDRDTWEPILSSIDRSPVPVAHILRFRRHPKRDFPQYRVMWSNIPIYGTTWEDETIFQAGQGAGEITQADMFWARHPGGRPPDVPRPQPGEPKQDVTYSDTDVQDFYGLDPEAHRHKRRKIRDAWRTDKHQLRKVKRTQVETVVRAAQAAAFAAGEPVPVLESDEEDELAGERLKRSPTKTTSARDPKPSTSKKATPRRGSSSSDSARPEPQLVIRTRTQAGLQPKPTAKRSAATKDKPRQPAPRKAGPASRVNAINKAPPVMPPARSYVKEPTVIVIDDSSDEEWAASNLASPKKTVVNGASATKRREHAESSEQAVQHVAPATSGISAASAVPTSTATIVSTVAQSTPATTTQPQNASSSASTSAVESNAAQDHKSSVPATAGDMPAAAQSSTSDRLKVESDVAPALFRDNAVDEALGLGQMYQTPALQDALRAAMRMADAIVAAENSGSTTPASPTAVASTTDSQAPLPPSTSNPVQTEAATLQPSTTVAPVASAPDVSAARQSSEVVASGYVENKGNEAVAVNSAASAQASESRESRVAQTSTENNNNNNDHDDNHLVSAGAAIATQRPSSPVTQKMEEADEEMNVRVKEEPNAAPHGSSSANASQHVSTDDADEFTPDVKPKLELLKTEAHEHPAEDAMALDEQATELAPSMPIEPEPVENPVENGGGREYQLELSPEPDEVDEEDEVDVDMDLGLASPHHAAEPVPTIDATSPPRAAEPNEIETATQEPPPTTANADTEAVVVAEAADVTMVNDDLWGGDSDDMDSEEVDRQIENVASADRTTNAAHQQTRTTAATGTSRGLKRGNMAMTAEDEELQKYLPKVPKNGPKASGLRRPTGIPGAAAMSSRIGSGPPPQPIPSNAAQLHLNKAVPLVNGSAPAARPAPPPVQVAAPSGPDPADLWDADLSMDNGNVPTATSSASAAPQPGPLLQQTAQPPAVDLADLWAADSMDTGTAEPFAPSTTNNAVNGDVQPPAAVPSASGNTASTAPPAASTANEYSRFEEAAQGWGDEAPAAAAPASVSNNASTWGGANSGPITNKAPPPANSSNPTASAWGAASSSAIDNDIAADLWGADDGGITQPAVSSGGWGDPSSAINRNAPPATGGQARQWGGSGGGSGGAGPNGYRNGPQGHSHGGGRYGEDSRAPARSPTNIGGGGGWSSQANPARSPTDPSGGWGGSGMNAARSPTTNTGGSWGSQPTSAQAQPSNWDTTSYSGPANNDRRVSSGTWGAPGNDTTGGGGAGAGAGGGYSDRGGRGSYRGGRGGFNSNGFQGSSARTPPGGAGYWGTGAYNSNGGRTPGPNGAYPGNKTPGDLNGGRTPGGRTPGSGRTTPGKASSGGRTPGGPSNWGAGPGESVSMSISIDAGNPPQQYVQQAPTPGHQAQAHMQMMQQQQQQQAQQQQQQQLQQQMQMQLQMQQQVIAIQTPTVDLRQQLTPFQQKRFDKWFNDSESETKLTVAHEATRAVLHFHVNDEMVKKITSSYVFIFKDNGGAEPKLAQHMVKVCKGGFRTVLDFDDRPFWTKDALIFIWRHAQDKLLTNTKPDAIAPFLNKAKRCSRLTFMVFGSEHPEVECKRSFEVVFPQTKRGGCLSFSLSGLLHHAYHADTKGKSLPSGQPPSLPVWKMAAKPPKNWRAVVHPWLIEAIRRCVKEGWQTQLFKAISFDYPIESRWLKELPDRIEKHITEMDAADTACGYGADLPEHDNVEELVLAVDKELLKSMHRTEMNHWEDERFDVVLTEGGSLLKLDEEAKAGVEVLRMDELKDFWAEIFK
ncbi:hypothetical protein OC846_005688 [Tilletia horrida]|uniref:Chromo domain-containing protein n=1 Tax=Tilletia horrida TaxID=155126 RepID=A0AAN6JRG5_9BASI|nr:hypothetical protein OC846_005688 [Tilletia horrida]KAK0560705.1 hypothetical protein OC861_006170 [Tilletia horrida]